MNFFSLNFALRFSVGKVMAKRSFTRVEHNFGRLK